jgi:exopolysaccharide biosynthesis predicted pyruvyltransferase EpsI
MVGDGNSWDERAPSAGSSIADSRQRLLRELSGAPDVTFIRAGGNIGDHLIQAGTRQLLAGIYYEETRVRRPREASIREPKSVWQLWAQTFRKEAKNQSHREVAIRGLEGARGHTALITGGGGWCRPFHRMWPTVLPLVERRFERVIVLPSSVDASFDKVKEVLARTKALVFARERESYRQLQELCETDIAHDCAFFFDFEPYKHNGEGLLTTYRTDAESAVGSRVPPGNNDISLTCDNLDQWLWTIAHHEAVETDRAHVMIAAAMLGKRVRYRPSNYHKVPAIAEYALEGFPVERIPEETEPASVGA